MMDESSSDAIAVPQIPLRAGESVRIVFDSRDGLIPASAPRGEAVVLTDQRVLRDGFADTGRVVTVFPLDELSAVEVASAGRSFERLGQGLMLLAAGLVLGGLSWIILEVLVLSVLLGGLPILGGVYSLTGWAFPDTDGALRLYARGHAIALPLRGNAAQATAHNAMQGIYELRWGSAAPSSESAAAPARESAIAPREAPSTGRSLPPRRRSISRRSATTRAPAPLTSRSTGWSRKWTKSRPPPPARSNRARASGICSVASPDRAAHRKPTRCALSVPVTLPSRL